MWAGVLCTIAALAPASENSGEPVDFHATVSAVCTLPAGNPMPGIHIQAKVRGRMTDIYLAPADFIATLGANVSKGDEVHIVGLLTRSGKANVVLVRQITIGPYTNGTLFLRDDDGPLWKQEP